MWTELHLLKCMGIFITWNWGEGKLVVFSCRTCPKHKLIILDYNSKHTFLTIFIKINRALWKEIIFQCVYNWIYNKSLSGQFYNVTIQCTVQSRGNPEEPLIGLSVVRDPLWSARVIAAPCDNNLSPLYCEVFSCTDLLSEPRYPAPSVISTVRALVLCSL